MSQGQVGNMDVAGTHWTVNLKHVYTHTHTHTHTDRNADRVTLTHSYTNTHERCTWDRQTGNTQTGRRKQFVNKCTSTTLSNMWARGRKDSMTSSGVVWAQDWREEGRVYQSSSHFKQTEIHYYFFLLRYDGTYGSWISGGIETLCSILIKKRIKLNLSQVALTPLTLAFTFPSILPLNNLTEADHNLKALRFF